ncbi:glycosyltransferase [Thalassospira lucentensis]|uniref:glycosyltransferase n=1 Tax=Thalassospira lucentensis TaxID=168935 RepID=UPI002942BB12|nr:glycosyltransferase [Thalassospira lucentensis]WOI09437.1 glycosyltransferase [Thalassospira lucentensis]
MTQDDAITVITTVRNGDAFLDRYFANLSDILRPQDCAVIVDDGSTNRVILPDGLKQAQLIRTNPIGRGAALNLAISHATTNLIAIQDIDDFSHPDRLSIQTGILRAHPHVLAFTAGQKIQAQAKTCRNQWREIPAARLYRSNPLHHSSLAFHRDIWQQAGGYDPDLPCCIDLDFYLRAAQHGETTIWRLDLPLITRNTDPATRHFASIQTTIHRDTLRHVLARHRKGIAPPIWMRLFDLKRALGIGI